MAVIPSFVWNSIRTWIVDTNASYYNIALLLSMILCSDGARTTMNSDTTVFFLLLHWSCIANGRWMIPIVQKLWNVKHVSLPGSSLISSFHVGCSCKKQCLHIIFVCIAAVDMHSMYFHVSNVCLDYYSVVSLQFRRVAPSRWCWLHHELYYLLMNCGDWTIGRKEKRSW